LIGAGSPRARIIAARRLPFPVSANLTSGNSRFRALTGSKTPSSRSRRLANPACDGSGALPPAGLGHGSDRVIMARS
jgi:hypothetical protein